MSVNGDIQNSIADDYLQQFDRSIGVAGMAKLNKWPFLQKLGFNGQLGHLQETFHGLKDFKVQMEAYSNSHLILRIAWSVISPIVLKNLMTLALTFAGPVLGKVGKLFQSISGFAQAFSISPEILTGELSKLKTKVQSYLPQ